MFVSHQVILTHSTPLKQCLWRVPALCSAEPGHTGLPGMGGVSGFSARAIGLR